ncbi:hypothetical protein EON66_07325 [archaeon]|nr:MAG: hypothetical protein EON66_07325 [archaeon]
MPRFVLPRCCCRCRLRVRVRVRACLPAVQRPHRCGSGACACALNTRALAYPRPPPRVCVQHPEAKTRVPFRDSKLTRLFADAFSGPTAGRTYMIINAGPAAQDFDETLQALNYGALAKDLVIVKEAPALVHREPLYNAQGHRIAHGASANGANDAAVPSTAGGRNAAAAVLGARAGSKKPTAPPPIHGPQPGATVNAGGVAAKRVGSDVRVARASLDSTATESSFISLSLVSAALTTSAKGEGSAAAETGGASQYGHQHGHQHGHHHGHHGHKRTASMLSDMGTESVGELDDLMSVHTGMDALNQHEIEALVSERVAAHMSVERRAWDEERETLKEENAAIARELEVVSEELEDTIERSEAIETEVCDYPHTRRLRHSLLAVLTPAIACATCSCTAGGVCCPTCRCVRR